MRYYLPAFIIGLWVPALHAATGCVMIAQGEATVIERDQQRTLPLRLAECDGIRIQSGVVSACYLNEQNARTCRTLKSGETFDAKTLGAREGGSASAFRATMLSLFRGDPQARIGQSRAEPPYAGFPYKIVLLADGDLVIHLTEKTRNITSLALRSLAGDAPPLVVQAKQGQLVVSGSMLVRGAEYAWEASGDGLQFSGRFRVAPASEVEAMRKIIKENAGSADQADVGQRILIAETYFEYGYVFDALELLARHGSVR
jgi:hypothetical protein